jgi:SAM-dependent methyltransferase
LADFSLVAIAIENGENILVRCSACGSLMTARQAPAAQVQTLYDALYTAGAYQDYRKAHASALTGRRPVTSYQRHLFHRVRKHLPGRRAAEIGGGVGVFGQSVVRAGFTYRNFDVSIEAAGLAERLGLSSVVFPAGEVPPLEQGSVDVVVMWEVLEHVWNAAEILRVVHAALAPGGCLLMSTPNLHRHGYLESLSTAGVSSPPIHINFFSRASLAVCLRAAGFGRLRFYHRKIEYPKFQPGDMLLTAGIVAGWVPEKTLYCAAWKE